MPEFTFAVAVTTFPPDGADAAPLYTNFGRPLNANGCSAASTRSAYVPCAGSGMNSGGGAVLPRYATVWNVALVNVTLSPAAIVKRDGRNSFSVDPFGVPAGGLAS